MLTTSCPKCEKEVTIPGAARAESRVRCPLCAEEYTLESVFADMPPLLEMLDAPATNGAALADAEADIATGEEASQADDTDLEPTDDTGGGMFDFDKDEDSATAEKTDEDGDIAVADPVETTPASNSFDFGGDATGTATSTGGTSTTIRKSRPRKKASPVKSIIGVIVGGLLAAPIAQFTLWYLPGGWEIQQRDPMGIGRKLDGTFLSFLVPSWVTDPNSSATAETDNGIEHSTAGNDNDNDPPEDFEESGGLGTLLGSAHDGNNGRKNKGNNRNNGNRNQGNRSGNNNGNNRANAGDNAAAGGDGQNSTDDSDDGPDGSGSDTDNGLPSPPQAGVKDAPTYTASDLADELKIVKEEVERFDDVTNQELDGGTRLAIRNDFFATVGKLAEVTTFAEDKPQGHREHLDEILAQAGSTPQKRRIIGVSAMAVMKQDNRDSNGIIITGEVKEVQQRGRLFETVVEVDATDNPPVSVYGLQDPVAANAFAKGDTVMVLGVIVDKPLDELRGYKGPPAPVIWGGYSQVIPGG